MSEPMPSIPTQSTFTYPNPNPSASPSFTQDDTSESFIPEPTQPIPTFTQTAFSQPAFSQPNQSIFSQPAVHFQQTQPTQTNQTGQQYPNNVQSQQFQQWSTGYRIADHQSLRLFHQGTFQRRVGYWMAFKARFGGNEESKKMRKTSFKQQFTEFSVTEEEVLFPSLSHTTGRSDSIMECVLHSFVAENEPDQDMIYEDFDQVDQLEMEELDLKWQMAMLSLRINRFEKNA
ncbi:hypothetical protein Tco_0919414 [Tanacetum coccineum]